MAASTIEIAEAVVPTLQQSLTSFPIPHLDALGVTSNELAAFSAMLPDNEEISIRLGDDEPSAMAELYIRTVIPAHQIPELYHDTSRIILKPTKVDQLRKFFGRYSISEFRQSPEKVLWQLFNEGTYSPSFSTLPNCPMAISWPPAAAMNLSLLLLPSISLNTLNFIYIPSYGIS
jgi:hypothetical protein